MTYSCLEVLSNALTHRAGEPVGALWSGHGCGGGTASAFAFLGALTVETAQGVLLPGRQASFGDVVANASGAMLGAWLFLALRRLERQRQ